MTEFSSTFYQDFPKIRSLTKSIIIDFFAHIIAIFQIYLLANALNINCPLHILLLLHFAAEVITCLPISISGIGIQQGALAVLYSMYGIEPVKAMVMSITLHVISKPLIGAYGLSAIGIYAFLKRKRSKAPLPVNQSE